MVAAQPPSHSPFTGFRVQVLRSESAATKHILHLVEEAFVVPSMSIIDDGRLGEFDCSAGVYWNPLGSTHVVVRSVVR